MTAFSSQNSRPEIKFAEWTAYAFSKNSKMRSYCSNIRVVYRADNTSGRGVMPLYQVYFNGDSWAVWRCPYIANAWERPKCYKDFETALWKAWEFYQDEDLEKLEIEIAESSKISWTKKHDRTHWEQITERTEFFSIGSEEAWKEIERNRK